MAGGHPTNTPESARPETRNAKTNQICKDIASLPIRYREFAEAIIATGENAAKALDEAWALWEIDRLDPSDRDLVLPHVNWDEKSKKIVPGMFPAVALTQVGALRAIAALAEEKVKENAKRYREAGVLPDVALRQAYNAPEVAPEFSGKPFPKRRPSTTARRRRDRPCVDTASAAAQRARERIRELLPERLVLVRQWVPFLFWGMEKVPEHDPRNEARALETMAADPKKFAGRVERLLAEGTLPSCCPSELGALQEDQENRK